MIPEFPKFKNLELTDKEDVEKFTSKFPPYSDFNFISMWCWDIHNKIKISQLNNNLVVHFCDYITNDSFLSFLGDKKVLETSSELITFSKKHYNQDFLKLIPEELFLSFKGSKFIAENDRDSFDYIYLVEHLANMNNWHQNTSGKRIRNFIKEHTNYVVKHSSLNEILPDEHHEMFKKWAESKNIGNYFDLNEFKAFKKLLKVHDKNLRLVSLYKGDGKTMIGFTIYEIVSKDYAISHFAKADKTHHSAIFDLLNWEEAKHLYSMRIKYFNWEQDLGIESLRYSKIKYKLAFFLKKLIIHSIAS